ncbi:uncharacterized protein LOC131687262 [Topomyia yanbarensis]|uniref:uncharacterized protein LOC131687262 n=1 Tax=Topomyia yanbarensis TaxID=2498891 RepID=UPI00273C58B6|nr:uncharacterized protein LOC131687262 [Topomyia yanbarensis]
MEHLAAKVLELVVNVARDNKKITNILCYGGLLPNIPGHSVVKEDRKKPKKSITAGEKKKNAGGCGDGEKAKNPKAVAMKLAYKSKAAPAKALAADTKQMATKPSTFAANKPKTFKPKWPAVPAKKAAPKKLTAGKSLSSSTPIQIVMNTFD